MTHVHMTRVSGNVKTGPIPVTTSGAQSCPKACPFNHSNQGGCYADAGPLAMHWRKVTSGERGGSFTALCDEVARLPHGQVWRHNQAGDLLHNDGVIDAQALQELVKANEGKRGFTYTHHDMTDERNQLAVYMANQQGFTVNLSGNNPAHADTLQALDIAPVVTVLPVEYQREHKGKDWTETLDDYRQRLETLPGNTPAGHKLVVCPATYRDDVTCESCKLCQRNTGKVIVGFPAHGTSKKKADSIARNIPLAQ